MTDKGKKIQISLCMGSACYPRGNSENLDLIRHYLEEHGLEACVELKGHRCQENCHRGPNIMVNDKAHHQVNTGMLPALLKELLPYFEKQCQIKDTEDGKS